MKRQDARILRLKYPERNLPGDDELDRIEDIIDLISDADTLKEINTITSDYYRIAVNIVQLEDMDLKADKGIAIIEDIRNDLKTKKDIPNSIIERFDDVFSQTNNPMYIQLRDFFQNENITLVEPLIFWSSEDLEKLRNLPLTSAEIERIFSVYKAMLRSNRKKFEIENFFEFVISKCILQKV